MNPPQANPYNNPITLTWAVYRLDDNGNQFVVRTSLGRKEARRLVSEFEARGHKQTYWAEEDPR